MQEIVVMTNRRTTLSVSPAGWMLAGALAAVVVGTAVGYTIHGKTVTQIETRHADEIGRLQASLRVAQAGQGSIERRAAANPVQGLSDRAVADASRLVDLLAAFPPFRTEVYRAPFAALQVEVQRQHTSAVTLAAGLRRVSAAADRCLSASSTAGQLVWTDGTRNLYTTGWTGQ
jgi:hypothetical protein